MKKPRIAGLFHGYHYQIITQQALTLHTPLRHQTPLGLRQAHPTPVC
ncbi:hypothetical protein HQ393_12605 [Chitinibacter bivalviorum]|uniref:Uncharacterized protein n=1 Tax=Chitinibacter bivalviorum TaxID=2739434 RepID=A0A7H9BLT7_9NEIS|nr:hypothetical protein [Chitinibacter bivalviorum]QLG89011.1 hypothetical protein HQ393_12605 [Chitinibacter bivalviorum]